MFSQKMSKSVSESTFVIVCPRKLETYANFLMGLISEADNKGSNDMPHEAVVWFEEDYESNRSQLTSRNKLLFIGDSEVTRTHRLGINEKFHAYGMVFGWRGNFAVAYLDATPILDKISNADIKDLCMILLYTMTGTIIYKFIAILWDSKSDEEKLYCALILNFFNKGLSDFWCNKDE